MSTLLFSSETQPWESVLLLLNSGLPFWWCKIGWRILFLVCLDFYFVTDKRLSFENQSLQGCYVAWIQINGLQERLKLSLSRCLPWVACCEGKPCQGCHFASSGDSDTSSALLLRAFTDSSEVPMLLERICGRKQTWTYDKLFDMWHVATQCVQVKNSFYALVDSSRCFWRHLLRHPRLLWAAGFDLDVFPRHLHSTAERPCSSAFSQQVHDLCPFMFIHAEVWVPWFFLQNGVIHNVLVLVWPQRLTLTWGICGAAFRWLVDSWVRSVDIFGILVCRWRHHAWPRWVRQEGSCTNALQ